MKIRRKETKPGIALVKFYVMNDYEADYACLCGVFPLYYMLRR